MRLDLTVTDQSSADAGHPLTRDSRQRQKLAYAELKRRIMHGELTPGTKMLERDVAALLDMSRTPVREAMIRLAEEGLIEVRPRHGMTVLPITADDLEEIYAVRTPLEAKAVAIAAERGVSYADLAGAEGLLARMEDATAKKDLAGWARADTEFHRLLVGLSRNRRLIAVVDALRVQLYRGIMATCEMRGLQDSSNADHRAVVDAIRCGDGALACSVHTAHLERTGAMLVKLLRTRALKAI